MKTETAKEIREALRGLKVIYNKVYDFDYDDYVLWHLNEAIERLEELC